MLFPFPVSPPQNPIPSSLLPLRGCFPIYPLLPHHPSIPLCWGIEPSQNKGLPSHWCQIRPSCATYVAGALDPSMFSLCLVFMSLGDPGGQVSWYCSSYGVAIPFSSFSPSLNSSIGVPGLSQWWAVSICIVTTRNSLGPTGKLDITQAVTWIGKASHESYIGFLDNLILEQDLS